MADVLVRAQGVGKKFCKNLNRSMLYGMQSVWNSLLNIPLETDTLKKDEFWALEDISFELKRGECLGLIGPNGSGKSTLLKILNGIISPDKGFIEIRGNVGALIEVGAGFHPMLSGRENIYINGAILGFSKSEIDKKLDAIIHFAEIEDFIDTSVKHYSSGMYVRLGFAIAAQMEPDILLIDEVLAVGDIGFRAKCFNAIDGISRNAAVIFVSHQMPQVARICTDICVLSQGKLTYIDKNVPEGINAYYSQFEAKEGVITGSGKATAPEIEFESQGRRGISEIRTGDELIIHLATSVDEQIESPVIGLAFYSQELQIIAQCISSSCNYVIHNNTPTLRLSVTIPKIPLSPGIYLLSVSITDSQRREVLVHAYAIRQLRILGDFIGAAPILLEGHWATSPS